MPIKTWPIVLALLTGCGSESPDPTDSDTDSGPTPDTDTDTDSEGEPTSVCSDHTFEHDGVLRFYRLCVPDPLPPGPMPVVMGFHGGGGGARNWSRNAPFDVLGATEGFITVYLQGCREGQVDCTAEDGMSWNIDKPGDIRTIDDEGYVLATLRRLSSEHGLETDGDRLYATGHSLGGMFAYALYCDQPELLAAIGPMSGAPSDGSCTPHAGTAIFHLHGAEDPNVPFADGCCSAAQQDPNDPAYVASCAVLPTCQNPRNWWPSVRGGDHPYQPDLIGLDGMAADGHACSGPPERSLRDGPLSCFTYTRCPQSRPEACVVDGIGHSLRDLNEAVPVPEHMWSRFREVTR